MLGESVVEAFAGLDLGEDLLDDGFHGFALGLLGDGAERSSKWQASPDQSGHLTSEHNAVFGGDVTLFGQKTAAVFGYGFWY